MFDGIEYPTVSRPEDLQRIRELEAENERLKIERDSALAKVSKQATELAVVRCENDSLEQENTEAESALLQAGVAVCDEHGKSMTLAEGVRELAEERDRLRASLTWTTEVPTEPDDYWCDWGGEATPSIEEIIRHRSGDLMVVGCGVLQYCKPGTRWCRIFKPLEPEAEL